MRSSAREWAAPRRTTTPSVPGCGSRLDPTRQLRRTLGNQATARLLAAEPAGTVPPAVRDVLSSPGQPLDLPTRRLMEPHFGYDFSGVRVHHGPLAAESAAAVNALAYTVGGHVVFGAGQYLPGTDHGRSLLAHELTHVVQQRNVTTAAGTPIRLGNPSDDAERRADAPDSQPTLRRAVAPVKTWAGTFTTDPYNATEVMGAGDRVAGYGAKIGITFKPNSLVDAERISFVQTARSVMDGKHYNKYDDDPAEKKTAESRSTSSGTHIDQFPKSRTPLYAPATSGWNFRDSHGVLRTQDATMQDTPDLNTQDIWVAAHDVQNGEWSQQFETTALATAGNQKGTYYGSVKWGWSKGDKDQDHRLLNFEAASMNVPTPTFVAAAGLWNTTMTSENLKPDEVPIADLRKVDTKNTELWEGPDKRVKIATLKKGTLVEQTDVRSGFVAARSWFWPRVTVLSGPHAGKTGSVWELDLSARKP